MPNTEPHWPDETLPSYVAIEPLIRTCLPTANAAAAAVPDKSEADYLLFEALRVQALAIEAVYGELHQTIASATSADDMRPRLLASLRGLRYWPARTYFRARAWFTKVEEAAPPP